MKGAARTFFAFSVLIVIFGFSVPGAALPRRGGGPGPLQGGEVWVARYDGAAHSFDRAEAIAVDSDGNVYVTGASVIGSNNWDYATVKYSPAGVQKWAKTYGVYTGTGSKVDYAHGLVLDAAGNIYVTGESAGENGWARFGTIKYTPLGVQAWVARSDFGGTHTDCAANALALDWTGNVYVTGYRFLSDSDESTKKDIATAKYTPTGAQVWTRTYDAHPHADDEGVAVAVDGSKNVYVAGYETEYFSGRNLRMIKYSTGGQKLWTKWYNGAVGVRDAATAVNVVHRGSLMVPITEVAVAGYSKVAATGVDCVTMVVKTDGTTRWDQRFTGQGTIVDVRPTAVTSDSAGNVYVAASGDCGGFFTLKYDVAGNLAWLRKYDGGLGNDYARAIAVDTAKNVYVTGQSDLGSTSFDYLTIKYDAAGNSIWQRRYDGTAHGYDQPEAIAVDNKGYVYVTGYSEGAGSAHDYLTIKYTAD